MSRRCGAIGCLALATRYGAYCDTHKVIKRRHGSPDQRGITKAALKPYLVMIQARIAANEGKTIWSLLDQRWSSLAKYVERLGKTTMNTSTRRAAQEICRLAIAVEPRKVVETVLAMYLMYDQAGYRFKSDQAFRVQMIRRVRGLTEANATFSTSGTTGRRARVYTDLPPKVVEVMAGLIIGTLGQAGVWIAKQEQAEAKRREQEREALTQGLAEVSFG